MYIDIDSRLRVNLMDMNGEETLALIRVIESAGLVERRIFHNIYRQLTKVPVDKLMGGRGKSEGGFGHG